MMAGPRQAKTGGRKPGVPNVVSTARVERAVAAGRKMPPDELLRNAENCRAMAARFAPKRMNEDTKEREDNPAYSPKDYHDWLAAERAALTAAAPYYAPRLTAIALQTSQLDRDKEARADPRPGRFASGPLVRQPILATGAGRPCDYQGGPLGPSTWAAVGRGGLCAFPTIWRWGQRKRAASPQPMPTIACRRQRHAAHPVVRPANGWRLRRAGLRP
jgi:hypothetical protein